VNDISVIEEDAVEELLSEGEKAHSMGNKHREERTSLVRNSIGTPAR
jgi:hypothetical protein